MYRFKIIIILFLLSSNLFSISQIDSLKQLIKKSDKIKKVELSIELSKKLLEMTKLSESIKFANNAIAYSRLYRNKELKIQAMAIIGRGFLIKGDLTNAHAYCDSVAKLSKKTSYNYGIGLGYQLNGILFSYSGKFEEGLRYIDSSLQIFNYDKFPLERALSFQTKATLSTYIGKNDSSDIYLKRALDIYKKNNSWYSYTTLKLNKALIEGTSLGQYENAIESALETLPYFEKINDSIKISTATSIIANCYDAIGNYDKAINYYLNAISLSEKSGNRLYLGNFINNLGEVYKHKGDFNKAFENYKKALKIFDELELIDGITVVKNNIGEYYLNKKEYDKALIYFNESISKVDQTADFYKLTIINRNIGIVYLKKAHIDKAILYLNNSIKFGKKMGLLEEIFPTYKSLAEAFTAKGTYKEAYKNMLLYSEGKDEFLKISNAERLTYIENKYQSEKKGKEIELLTKSKEIQNLQLENQQYITIVLFVVLILIAGESVFLYKRYTSKKKTNTTLEKANKIMKQYADELELTNYQLKESEENLKNINATKDKFFSIISHDLKGPFFSLLGLSEIMSEGLDDLSKDEIKEMSLGINRASKKVFTLLENLLEWSRAQLGMINVEKQLFDFNELVIENSKLYKSNFKQKGIELIVDLNEDSKIFADREMLNFALRNLLNNAIKFTDETGKIFIKTQKENSNFIIKISDTGLGMDEKSIEKLFKIESTFSTEGTKKEKGTGLGLILVNEFIQKNNGKILVESKIGKGSTFTIKLPLN